MLITATNEQSEKTPLEKAQDFPVKLATGFQLYHTLRVLDDEAQNLSTEEYQRAIDAVCELIYAVVEPVEA